MSKLFWSTIIRLAHALLRAAGVREPRPNT
jgi:hypothetical protein